MSETIREAAEKWVDINKLGGRSGHVNAFIAGANYINNQPIDGGELTDRIKQLEKELHQQRFNNEHNLSIDQTVADSIGKLDKEIENLRQINQSEALLNTSLHREREKSLHREREKLQKERDEAVLYLAYFFHWIDVGCAPDERRLPEVIEEIRSKFFSIASKGVCRE